MTERTFRKIEAGFKDALAMIKEPLCLYHASCVDGLGAAYAVHRAIPDAEFIAVRYGEPPPERATDRDILIVDFSYPRDVLEALARANRSVLVLDHHATAQEQLRELAVPPGKWEDWLRYGPIFSLQQVVDDNGNDLPTPPRLAAVFDMDRSGAGLTWDYLHGQHGPSGEQPSPRPHIIDLIEDYDLWRFAHGDETRAFNAVITSYDLSDLPAMFARFDEWDQKSLGPDITSWAWLIAEGRAILRSKDALTASVVRASRRTMRLAGHVVPVACIPGALASEAGHLLIKTAQVERAIYDELTLFGDIRYDEAGIGRIEDAVEHGIDDPQVWPPFSATYYDGADSLRHFSLRSPPGGAHVGNIARDLATRFEADWQNLCVRLHDHREGCFVGGGHEHASGFTAPLGWEGE